MWNRRKATILLVKQHKIHLLAVLELSIVSHSLLKQMEVPSCVIVDGQISISLSTSRKSSFLILII